MSILPYFPICLKSTSLQLLCYQLLYYHTNLGIASHLVYWTHSITTLQYNIILIFLSPFSPQVLATASNLLKLYIYRSLPGIKLFTVVPLLSTRETFQDTQWMYETTNSTKPCIYYSVLSYTYIQMIKFYL